MNRMLVTDAEMFSAKYREAESFLTAAHLRYEAYCLALKPDRTTLERDRLQELLDNAPACKEPWFVAKLKLELQNRGACGYCGSLEGTYRDDDGWLRCNACGGA